MIRKIFYILILNLLFADGNNVYYLKPGPNLVSFNILPSNTSVDNIFSNIENDLISIITESQISHRINNNWVGTLTNIDNINGYWIIANEITLLDVEGIVNDSPTYYLETGANLVSYPHSQPQTLEDAIPFYMDNYLSAIIGENKAALFINGQVYGSLDSFEPNKAYWFFLNNSTFFEYNFSENRYTANTNNNTFEDENTNAYNQSTLQSIFFVNKAFINGNSLTNNDDISVLCNGTLVGGKKWNGNMTDVIAMGYDGYEFTSGYCNSGENINIKINNLNMHITGNSEWNNNTISIISISDFETGDVNLDYTKNITDIIIIIEHIIDTNLINNEHQLFLSDINNDETTNITDIINLVDLVIE